MTLACIVAALIWLLPAGAGAQDNVWELVTEDGQYLTSVCYEPEAGDQYISGDNRLYQITDVRENTARIRLEKEIGLPDVSWLDADTALEVGVMNNQRRIVMYCTHSDESYEPSDGTYSDDHRGSIYQVADRLAAELEEKGIASEASDALHYPHDAGAYRRSRQTAVGLLKSLPDAVLDVHRDGIPDPDEYKTDVGGKECSKIRLLVGRGNHNMEVNKSLALKIKAVADKLYPGLIKDIYMGKGTYNQDLSPQSLLLECGTYTLDKDLVMRSMPLMAEVISRTLYGGVTGSAGASDVQNGRNQNDGIVQGAPDPVAMVADKGVSSGVAWVVGIGAVALIGYGILSAGSIGGGMKKAGRNLNEMTGGLLGKKPEDDENPHHS